MTVTAKLAVVLKADDLEVARSEDSELWQRVLQAISGLTPFAMPVAAPATGATVPTPATLPSGSEAPTPTPTAADTPLSRMAHAVGVSVEELTGACAPSLETPFLVLDAHCYEGMRRALPGRGTKAMSNIQVAGTVLSLWFYYSGQGPATQAQTQAILEALGQRDPNAARGIANADWLQARGAGQFIVNPGRISTATLITKCFCSRDWSTYLSA